MKGSYGDALHLDLPPSVDWCRTYPLNLPSMNLSTPLATDILLTDNVLFLDTHRVTQYLSERLAGLISFLVCSLLFDLLCRFHTLLSRLLSVDVTS